jgi:hypothetical protein
MISGVLVVCHISKDTVAEAFVLTFPVNHSFLLMVIAILHGTGDVWCFS